MSSEENAGSSKDKAGPAAGKKRDLFFYFAKDQPPKKRAPQTEQTEQQQHQQPEQQQQQGQNTKALSGAAAYRCSFKNEWTTKWPFITKGTLSTYYWCSVCRVENTCCHQGVADVVRHTNSKGHQDKQRALQSAGTIDRFSVPAPSVGGMTDQEAKVGYMCAL